MILLASLLLIAGIAIAWGVLTATVGAARGNTGWPHFRQSFGAGCRQVVFVAEVAVIIALVVWVFSG